MVQWRSQRGTGGDRPPPPPGRNSAPSRPLKWNHILYRGLWRAAILSPSQPPCMLAPEPPPPCHPLILNSLATPLNGVKWHQRFMVNFFFFSMVNFFFFFFFFLPKSLKFCVFRTYMIFFFKPACFTKFLRNGATINFRCYSISNGYKYTLSEHGRTEHQFLQ